MSRDWKAPVIWAAIALAVVAGGLWHLYPLPDAGERLEGFTNPLWVMILALGLRLGLDPEVVSLGLSMLALPGYLAGAGGWIWLKLVLVAGLLVMHRQMVVWRNAFARDANVHPQRFFRIANEIPTLLMVGIVILVVTRPF